MERARNRKHIPLRCQFDLILSNETHRSPGSGLSRSEGLATVFRSSAARLPARSSLLSSSKSGAQVPGKVGVTGRSEEHTSELQSRLHLVCRLLLEKKTYH